LLLPLYEVESVRCAHPDIAPVVFEQTIDGDVPALGDEVAVIYYVIENAFDGVEPVKPPRCAHPKKPLCVNQEGGNIIIGKAVGVRRVILVGLEADPVIPVEAIVGPQPDKPLAVLDDLHDRMLGEPVFDGKMVERPALGMERQGGQRHRQQYNPLHKGEI
jgi:hypothetical protein